MAPKKPDAKKPAGKPSGGISGHMFEIEIKIFLAIVFVAFIYFTVLKGVLQSLGYTQDKSIGIVSTTVGQGLDIFNGVFNTLIFLSVFLILLFILGAIYYKYKHKQIVALYKIGLPKGYVSSLSSTATGGVGGDSADNTTVGASGAVSDREKIVLNPSGENKKWDEILKHITSMNTSDWRVAILEADILLYEMLDQMGYDGDTIAEKLKLVESSDFNTIDLAWRAHKVRNAISHEGSSYEMSYEQAKNTIDLYRKVFEEFYFI
jgi:hypothetical protein